MTEQLTWRPGSADDAPLLLALFGSTKGAELAPLGFTAGQLEPLLQMQFHARQMSYGSTYPRALDMILCLEDGTAVGRHLVDRQTDCYRSVDLAVLPEYRGRGIGAWAVRQVQRLAEAEGVPMRLRAIEGDRAVALYERLGFEKFAGDEISCEMEWRPAKSPGRAPAPPKPEAQIALQDGRSVDRIEVVNKILGFVTDIGLRVEMRPVTNGFLPGVCLVTGGLRVDIDRLLYPGDLLHEAGHLAVMPPERRMAESPTSTTDGGEEMAAMAWSYAAALHLDLPPEIVFHEHGYKGQGQFLNSQYQSGGNPGVPLLWWLGLTAPPADGQPSSFPRMTRWLCAELPSVDEDSIDPAEICEVHA